MSMGSAGRLRVKRRRSPVCSHPHPFESAASLTPFLVVSSVSLSPAVGLQASRSQWYKEVHVAQWALGVCLT